MPQLKPVGKKVIAIDGPAGSGKSTVARAVAARLGMPYLDTGAMYRAVAFAAMRRGVDPEDAADVAKLTIDLALKVTDRVLVDGVDATIEVRSPEVTRAVSVGGRQSRGAKGARPPPAGMGRGPRLGGGRGTATSAPSSSLKLR